jgi:hypothetical protein
MLLKESLLIVIARQDDVVKLSRFEDTGEKGKPSAAAC